MLMQVNSQQQQQAKRGMHRADHSRQRLPHTRARLWSVRDEPGERNTLRT